MSEIRPNASLRPYACPRRCVRSTALTPAGQWICVCVPQQKTWTETVTCYESQAEEVTRTVTVCVPHQVQKEVQVNVCRMVPKTVQVPVQCGSCCRGCGLRACRRGC